MFGNSWTGQASQAQPQAGGNDAGVGQAGGETALIKDVTTASFREDVIAESMNQPVLVDFWAPWCGPCKQLTPIIEKAVAKAAGKVKLAKMNIDDHPSIAGQLGIQSIPAVIAFDKGRPVDGFMGAQSESQIDAFIGRIAGPSGPSPVEQALEQAAALAGEGDAQGAAQLYAAVLQQESDNAPAIAGMARLHLDLGDAEGARRFLDMAPPEKAKDPAIVAARAALDLAEQAAKLGETGELEARLAADPDDHQARFDLAVALAGANRRVEAAEHLVEIVRRDRAWNDDGARKQLLQFFEAWGPKDPGSTTGRRKLSAVLFS
ncbi:MAG: thioredoxin [Salinarimonadaceae bacterium]|nr:MAG: thioredoxin [Salinarimonadaceae bacterium]